jgi:hypothetical protein
MISDSAYLKKVFRGVVCIKLNSNLVVLVFVVTFK